MGENSDNVESSKFERLCGIEIEGWSLESENNSNSIFTFS